MSAAVSRSDPPLQRASGELRIAFRRRGAATVLADLRQQGCLKARFPDSEGWREAVMLNSSGGIAGGDRLALALHLDAGAQAGFAAQAAERFYRALPEDSPAHVRTRITIAAGAAGEWLPQESILFDGAALDRRLDVEMDPAASFLGVEMLVFGRAAMGERVRHARLADTIRINRGGRLVLHEAIRLVGDVDSALARPSVAAGGQAVATLVHVAPDAEARLEALRAAWADRTDCGASAWDGMLLARVVARGGQALRAAVTVALAVLRDGRALPRVWMC